VATTLAEDGHRQNTKTSTAIQSKRKKEHRATEEEIEGPTASGGLRNRLTRLNLHKHDDEEFLLTHMRKYYFTFFYS
jgi:hypothetical protein